LKRGSGRESKMVGWEAGQGDGLAKEKVAEPAGK